MNMSQAQRNQSAAIAAALLGGGITVAWYYSRYLRPTIETPLESSPDVPIREVDCSQSQTTKEDTKLRILSPGTISIVHASITGTCEKLARQLYTELSLLTTSNRVVQVGSVQEWDWWDELLNEDDEDDVKGSRAPLPVLILLLPTYTNGTWPPFAADTLERTLQDVQHDWRVQSLPLKNKLQVAIFGMGSSEYDDTMGRPARECVRHFQKLGAKCLLRLKVGDDAVGDHAKETFHQWNMELQRKLKVGKKEVETKDLTKNGGCACGEESKPNGGCHKHAEEPLEVMEERAEYESDDEDEEDVEEPTVMDLEDMGNAMASEKKQVGNGEPREMVTPRQAQQLKKEGYKLIGTHSAVKLCRWTKHQLRGRGGCYKHTFYGITSYQCMEATPSLACANKCVFCWRHHKNPVGKEWRWKTDDPQFIVEQAVQTHVNMIKETKGIPGVQMDRWKEAHTVRHCALSLVGEPIMYPRINEFLSELHHREISTFLVTNGQHPQAIESLLPITQLYVSVDAPTKESLIAIDRPLFQDAWDRLKQSLVSLKNKGQRTVARLTVVKGWNSDEVSGYAKLIALGHVSLVEIKGVTFCGKSDASNLNMSNSPWHHEVVDLAKTLQAELNRIRETDNAVPQYDLACEHKHSCSVLLARVDQFLEISPEGERQWHTWINYPKFQELAARHEADPSFTFHVKDYTAPTPEWALFGAEEEGFDPTDTRHRKATKQPKYTQYDDRGIPTHDHTGQPLAEEERQRLFELMEARMREIGTGSTVTELRGGAKEIQDASLMFRGLVVSI
ncbi:tRNA wybutosine-synthesizing protein 1 [Fistulifera solaris]|jgi:tRNA wybutosine-synthesizing protein 1|uniref:tRNA 4-demethylwyosine synthase (AdoMet-dependent) n=1 Tax=Fistulifera solaris TaxID=1519565 RepID=A0A1Z5K4H5_FISSO|nr:tRNA wybutosine-synthesizing protein 1 [Fistulifera solaris]|eukprot:GAX20868.1 tRNA wybutosine-synthesizing protein 1 [Fistulifera solaris]